MCMAACPSCRSSLFDRTLGREPTIWECALVLSGSSACL
jgi:hypothetical protein